MVEKNLGGRPPLSGKTLKGRLQLRVAVAVEEAFRRKAEALGEEPSAILRRLIEQWVKVDL